MRCGSKCFLIELEADGEKQEKTVIARTPAEARKTIRRELGRDAQILTIREAKK